MTVYLFTEVSFGNMESIVKLYHFAAFVVYGLSLYYDLNYAVFSPEETVFNYRGYAGKFKFLTFWCFILQTVYFGLCTANDLCGSNSRPSHRSHSRSTLQRMRDNMLATLAFPVGMFVVLTFWAIYAVDRELVYPKKLDAIIPPWLNHVMHTTVLPFLLIDKYIVYHQYPSRKTGITILLSFAAIYLIWILWIAYYANIWVYPVLRVMVPYQRAAFIIVLLIFFISIYIMGEAINKFVWGKEREILLRENKGKKSS